MEFRWILSRVLPVFSISVATIAPAGAAQMQTSFQVTANIPGICSAASATTLAFSTYNGGQNDQAGSISVTCTTGTAYRLGLNEGANYFAPNRRMKHGTADYLIYDLYSDATRTTRWGNDDSSDVHMNGNGTAQNINVYGRIPAGQSGPIGDYADTIIVTVTLNN